MYYFDFGSQKIPFVLVNFLLKVENRLIYLLIYMYKLRNPALHGAKLSYALIIEKVITFWADWGDRIRDF